MTIEHDDDLRGLTAAGRAVAEARDAMLAAVAPGVTPLDLDALGARVLAAHGARSAPRLAYGFPGVTCISVNDVIAHGVPDARPLREGDVVNVDVSAEVDGYYADTGASVAVGAVSARVSELLRATRRAQAHGMDAARAGRPLRGVAHAVERSVRGTGFRLVRNLGGHGIGRSIHEDPFVGNVVDRRDRTVLHEGLVITIEPFLTLGRPHAVEDRDGWALRTPDRALGAQHEHTLVIRNGAPLVLTA